MSESYDINFGRWRICFEIGNAGYDLPARSAQRVVAIAYDEARNPFKRI